MIGRKGAVGDILATFLMQKVTLSRILKYITNCWLTFKRAEDHSRPGWRSRGKNKAEAIAAAMKGGYINALVPIRTQQRRFYVVKFA